MAHDETSVADEATKEAALEQIHQVLVEVNDYLERTDDRAGQKLQGKVELVLENWNDDAFFSEDEDGEDDEDDD